MSQITCNCGNTYDSGFKFCPECAAPNPEYAKNQSPDPSAPKPMKKRFTKAGESSLNKSTSEQKPVAAKPVASPSPAPLQKAVVPKKTYTIVRQTPPSSSKPVQQKTVQQKPVAQPSGLYEEYEDEEEETIASQPLSNYKNYDYEDEEAPETESSPEEYENEEDYEDDEETVDEDESAPAPAPSPLPFKGKGKVLAAPAGRSNRNAAPKTVASIPKTKKVTQTKSSLGRNKPDYDPNHDGYYDDRLPAILDEVTKTSHMDVILKISLSAVCIATLITYCIFYVQV